MSAIRNPRRKGRLAFVLGTALLPIASLLSISAANSAAAPAHTARVTHVTHASTVQAATILASELTEGTAVTVVPSIPAAPKVPARLARTSFTANAAHFPALYTDSSKGWMVAGWWFGPRYELINGKKVYVFCIYLTGGLPHGEKIVYITSLGEVVMSNGTKIKIGGVKTAELRRVLERPINTKDRGAAVYDALNRIAGVDKKNFNSVELHAHSAVRKAAASYVADARAHHGNSTVSMKITQPATYVGQTGTAMVTVTNNTAGKLVKFSATNATITSSARTNSKGQATVHYRPFYLGSGTLFASVGNLASNKIGVGIYIRGQQELVTRAAPITLKTHVPYGAKFKNTTLRVVCQNPCTGKHVPLVASAISNSSKGTLYATATVGGPKGKSLGTFAIKPGSTLKAPTWYGTDGDKDVTVTLSEFVGGHKLSQVVGTLKEVICLEVAPLTFSTVCNCNGNVLKVSSVHNDTAVRTWTVVVNGKPSVLAPGQTYAGTTLTSPRGTPLTVAIDGYTQYTDAAGHVQQVHWSYFHGTIG